MATWYIDLNLSSSPIGANTEANPYSSTQMVSLLQGDSVNGYSANDDDVFKLKGYKYDATFISDSNLDVTIEAWDLTKYGFWGFDSFLDVDYPKIDMYGGVIYLNAPDRFVVRSLTNVNISLNNPGDSFRLVGIQSEGITMALQGTIGKIFQDTSSFVFRDSVIITESPFSGDDITNTIVSLNHTTVNLSDGVGASAFYGGSYIVKGTDTSVEYGWSSPPFSSLPYLGYSIPPSYNYYQFFNSEIFKAPFSTYSTSIRLSDGEHYGYELDLYGGKREYDDGSVSGRTTPSPGIGAYWFPQDGIKLEDTKSTDEAVFDSLNYAGAFYTKSLDINSGVQRGGCFLKSATDDFWSAVYEPTIGNPYLQKFGFMIWVRGLNVDGFLTLLSYKRLTNIIKVLVFTDSTTLKVGYSLNVTLPTSLSTNTWKLLTVTITQGTYYARVYLDKTLIASPSSHIQFYEPSMTIGATYTPQFFYSETLTSPSSPNIGGEYAKLRLGYTQTSISSSIIESVYDTEFPLLPG
jgi:hypothetical protein